MNSFIGVAGGNNLGECGIEERRASLAFFIPRFPIGKDDDELDILPPPNASRYGGGFLRSSAVAHFS